MIEISHTCHCHLLFFKYIIIKCSLDRYLKENSLRRCLGNRIDDQTLHNTLSSKVCTPNNQVLTFLSLSQFKSNNKKLNLLKDILTISYLSIDSVKDLRMTLVSDHISRQTMTNHLGVLKHCFFTSIKSKQNKFVLVTTRQSHDKM